MGDVVSVNNQVIPSIADSLGMTAGKFVEIAHSDALDLMAGKITEQEFWEKVSGSIGKKLPADLFAVHFHPVLNQDVADLVRELSKTAPSSGGRSVRLVVGTNTIPSHYRIHLEAGHYDMFDKVYPSHQLGLIKPAPGFYHTILDRESREPGETVFIDDLAENVEAARNIGINAILFTTAGDLSEQLGRLG
jgi:putative hydrolase of the HAD superfamily